MTGTPEKPADAYADLAHEIHQQKYRRFVARRFDKHVAEDLERNKEIIRRFYERQMRDLTGEQPDSHDDWREMNECAGPS